MRTYKISFAKSNITYNLIFKKTVETSNTKTVL